MILRIILAILLGATMIKVKHLVKVEKAKYSASLNDIALLQNKIEIMQAEYIYLTRPERIVNYARSHGYKPDPQNIFLSEDYFENPHKLEE